MLGHCLLHYVQITSQQVLSSQHVHGRQVVCSLVILHLQQESWQDGTVDEPDVPVFFVLHGEAEVCLVGGVLYNFILGIVNVDHQGPVSQGLRVEVQSLADKLAGLVLKNIVLVSNLLNTSLSLGWLEVLERVNHWLYFVLA